MNKYMNRFPKGNQANTQQPVKPVVDLPVQKQEQPNRAKPCGFCNKVRTTVNTWLGNN